jgi:hypothetical protein
MLTNLKKWWHAFQHNYNHHLEIQDKFLFPLRTWARHAPPAARRSLPRLADGAARVRCAVATKMSKEEVHAAGEMSHAKMVALLAAATTALEAQSTQAEWDLTGMHEKFSALDTGARAHMAVIEAGPMEILRREFTHKEVKWALEKHVVNDGSKQDAGWLLARAFGTDPGRDDWLARVPVMPASTRKNSAIPAAHAYLNGTHKLLQEIIDGKHAKGHASAADAGGCCVIA